MGLVMAGGLSRRFGSDKAAVEVAGETLLQRTVDLLRPHVESLYVSVREDQRDDSVRASFPLLLDDARARGPAAGLLAAHATEPDKAWCVLACDLPQLDAQTLNGLFSQRDAKRQATAIRSPADGRPEPLCAVYEPNGLADICESIKDGALSPRDLLVGLDLLLVEPATDRAMLNMNRPSDWLRRPHGNNNDG